MSELFKPGDIVMSRNNVTYYLVVSCEKKDDNCFRAFLLSYSYSGWWFINDDYWVHVK